MEGRGAVRAVQSIVSSTVLKCIYLLMVIEFQSTVSVDAQGIQDISLDIARLGPDKSRVQNL